MQWFQQNRFGFKTVVRNGGNRRKWVRRDILTAHMVELAEVLVELEERLEYQLCTIIIILISWTVVSVDLDQMEREVLCLFQSHLVDLIRFQFTLDQTTRFRICHVNHWTSWLVCPVYPARQWCTAFQWAWLVCTASQEFRLDICHLALVPHFSDLHYTVTATHLYLLYTANRTPQRLLTRFKLFWLRFQINDPNLPANCVQMTINHCSADCQHSISQLLQLVWHH